MIIKAPVEFQPYKDGVCDIYTEDEEGIKTYKTRGVHFDNRILGFKRVYAAKAVQTDINRVIRIPSIPGIDAHDRLQVTGENHCYDIELVQYLANTNPPSADLTLRKVGAQ